jgi:release factor glutamine methyltransferase
MLNIREIVTLSSEYLEKKGVSHARRVAEELLAHLLKKRRMELYFNYDAPIQENEVNAYREMIHRKGEKEPLAYIIGHVEFLDLKLKVTPATLIPRHETEILADLIIKQLPETKLVVWDLCCGSGCLGLSIKKRCPQAEVVLSDVSPETLAVAKENAGDLEVTFLEGDLLEPYSGKADVVVCNPPYITLEEYEGLEDEVKLYEPKRALVGGLLFYERLAKKLPPYLNENAKIFFEIGAGQGAALLEVFSESHWLQKKCEKDWSGHDRFFFLEYHKKDH